MLIVSCTSPHKLDSIRVVPRFKHHFLAVLCVCTIAGVTLAHAAAPAFSFTVNLSEAVTVDTAGGTPRIAMNIGGLTRYALYAGGSGTANLTFTYTATPGDLDLDGVAITPASIDLNSGTIKDLAGNDAELTFTAPDTSNLRVDYPGISATFTSGTEGRYTLAGTAYSGTGAFNSFLSAASATFTRNSVGTYYDSAGTLQTATNNTPRFDHDPVTHAAKGLLIEEARTNYIRNSTMAGASAGAPGTSPTYWSIPTASSGLTREITGVGTEDGLPYIDLRMHGTTNGSQTQWTLNSAINSVAGEVWTLGMYARLVSGSYGTMSAGFRAVINENGSSGYLAEGAGTAVTLDSQRRYLAVTRTVANASTIAVQPYLKFTPATGQTLDFTIRLYAPQIEKAAFATSFIPTSGTTVSRAADVFSISTGSWHDAAKGVLMAEYDVNAVNSANYPGVAVLHDGTNSNAITLYINGSSLVPRGQIKQASTISFDDTAGGGALTLGARAKSALLYQANNGRYSNAGSTSAQDTSVSVPTVTTLQLGGGSNVTPLNGHVAQMKYYPNALPASQLQLLTQ